MRQVPNSKISYGLVGGGRLARHLLHYFHLLEIPVTPWKRGDFLSAAQALRDSDVILVAISDHAIVNFVREFKGQSRAFGEKTFIHFSGSLVTTEAFGVHPLMTFSESLYDRATYESISFVCDTGVDFRALFPRLPNQFFGIAPATKPLYHALCVLSGNFTVLLWEKFFHELEEKFQIPRAAAHPYLKRTYENLLHSSDKTVLTGPLNRGDTETIEKNLSALKNDEYQDVYRAFVGAFNEIRRNHDEHP